jgi:transcriptional regulator with XRE-family HTH domain
VKHVRKFLGERLRALRKERGLSQERLGQRSRLSFENHVGELLKHYQTATARRLRGGPEA